jgi:hypothetical protein
MSNWVRHRFQANADDYRPMTFPTPGPYWCSGYAGDGSYATVIAYLPEGMSPASETLWPEADKIDSESRDKITFTDRFPCPEWWDEIANQPKNTK